MIPPKPVFCAVCGFALHPYARDGEVIAYLHHAAELSGEENPDHIAIPVSASQLQNPNLKCDFCSSLNPRWVYFTTEFEIKFVNPETHDEFDTSGRSDSGWAACEKCAEYVENRDIPGLVTRVMLTLPGKLRKKNRLPIVKRDLYQAYEVVIGNLYAGKVDIHEYNKES